jgi:hypothetical protein
MTFQKFDSISIQTRMTHPLEYLNRPEFKEQRKAYRVAISMSPTHMVFVVIDMTGLSPGEALMGSKKITDQICLQESEYRTAIARELLPVCNESPGGKAIKADEFKRRIALAEIKVNPANYGSAGCATLYYADGNLFAGRSIEVLLDGDLGYAKSQLIGNQVSSEDYAYVVRKPDAAEALAWLREAKTPGDRTITGGDGEGWRGAKAIAVVQELYDLGAVSVTAAKITGRIEKSKQQDTSRLIVQLPEDKKKRARLFGWEAKFARKFGWDPATDCGQDFLLIWRD